MTGIFFNIISAAIFTAMAIVGLAISLWMIVKISIFANTLKLKNSQWRKPE